ncbi:MAG: FG-GAP-like repeat-containing protein, partial [Candidatus Zixiibacteriota bacterium]
VGALNSSDIFLLLGDANGALTVSSQVAAGGRPWMLAVGDVNGDGNVDVVSANSTSNNAAVIFGDGAGGMSAATTYPTGAFTLAIDLGDIDGDGDLDLVTSNFSGNDWALYENDGFGVFGNPRTFPASSSGSCAILHDRDNDGDLDMTGIDETDDLLFIFDNDYRAIRVSADTLFGEAPLDVSFSAETDQTVIAWNWSFGDGDSAQVQSPMHSYQNPGVFTVSASILTADSEFVEILADFIGVYADSLILQSVSGTPGATARMEIYARNFLPQSFIRIPFTWTGALDAVFTGADNSGLRSADMSGAISDIDPFNQRATYTLVAPVDSPLAPGEGPVATLFFRLPDTGAGDTMTVQILPFGSSSPLFVSTFGLYEPLTLPGLVTIACCEVAGDANNDGKVNIADVTFLIARIFASGPAPDCADKANADGAGPVNVADVTYLILRIFAAGPAPVCGNSGL